MFHKYIHTAFIAVLTVLLASGVSYSADKAVHAGAAGQDAGSAKASPKPHFDETGQDMTFTDGPAAVSGLDEPGPEGAQLSPSASELLRAMDVPGTAPSAVSQADAGTALASGDSQEFSLLDPLSVESDESRDHIERNVSMFSKTLKDHFKVWLGRSGKYLDMMKSVFREKNLPEDLVYLALIESGFNPKAYSFASASGPWQFISGTAKKYGLKINSWVDERRDPEKSTRAAAEYLEDLYNMFGTWSLAMAAYNSGEGNVSRAVQRNGTLDFWELRKTRSLARETKEYVPRYLAARAIALSPQAYGLDDIEYEEPLSYDVVRLDKPVDLDVAAQLCGTTVDVIKELNPELKRWCTPPNTPGYRLRVPKGTAEQFLAGRDSMPPSETANWKEYVAKRGDTISKVAARHHVSAARLADVNSLKRSSRLSRGQRIIIPVSSRKSVTVASGSAPEPKETASAGTSGTSSEKTVASVRTHKVRRGETLAKVARRYGMSTSRLASLNGLHTKSKLRTGQVLKVTVQASAEPEPEQSTKPVKTVSSRTYRVRKGDTLTAIAGRHGLTSDALADMNGISKHAVLRVGQRIRVNGGAQGTEASGSSTYRVRPGDTLWSISRELGVSIERLMDVNSLDAGSTLKPGMELTVPGKEGIET